MADKNGKINDEKRLRELIRKVLKLFFCSTGKKHLKPYYFSITKQQIKEVKKGVVVLGKSIEFTENQPEEKENNDENKLADIEHRIEEVYDKILVGTFSSRS